MAIIDFVKWNGNPDLLAYKFPSEELSTWTQLIVNESQEAFVVRGGVYEGPFGAGRHTLSTANIPILREFMGLPFGGQSPFSAEVWFVNRATHLDVRWGTTDPIQLQDPKYHTMVPIRAFGQYGIRIDQSKQFLLKLVGTLSDFGTVTLSEYFRGAFMTRIKTEIANAIITRGVSVLDIATQLQWLSDALKVSLSGDVSEYGVALAQFNIHSINMPEDDSAVVSLKKALAKRAEMGILGFDYQQERSLDILQAAASNQGSAGGVMGAGLGLGMGVAMGGPMGNAFGQVTQQLRPEPQPAPTATPAPVAPNTHDEGSLHADRIKMLKELADLKTAGVLTDAEFQIEKSRILGH